MSDSENNIKSEYTESNFSALNVHAEGIVDNERQLTRLKRFRADRALIKNITIVILALGIFILLLAFAYSRYKAPVYDIVEKPVYIEKPVTQIVEKPVYIEKPVYQIVKIPDPNLSQVIEVPIYIEKIIKVPIQVTKKEGTITNFTFFNHRNINRDGITKVTVGASYESVNSPYPENQWCYATGDKNISNNNWNDVSLANKEGLGKIILTNITPQDADIFGASLVALRSANTYCEFFPTKPPIEDKEAQISRPDSSLPSEKPKGSGKSGTGFYINDNGFLLTNHHVVSNCSSLWVEENNKSLPAVVVKFDSEIDIAAIKVNKSTSNYAKFGEVRSGEDVLALGFPLTEELGQEIKVTKGNISALSGVKGDKNFLQFTAPIQSGNSGGPLLNEGGFVVGINTAKMVGEKYQNVNFAIKGSTAQQFLGKNGIDFYYENYEDVLNSADITELGMKYTVQILCYQ